MDREIGDAPRVSRPSAATRANSGWWRHAALAKVIVGRVEQAAGGDRFQHRQVINRAVFI